MKKDNKPRFIPCGDSMEKMEEIKEENLKDVTGGEGSAASAICPKCGAKMKHALPILVENTSVPKFICTSCRYVEW